MILRASVILAMIPLPVSSVRVSRIKQGRLLLVLAVRFCSGDSFLLHSGTRRSAFRRGRNFYFIITAVRTMRGLARALQVEREREKERKRERPEHHQERSSSSALRTFSLVYRQVPTSDWFRLETDELEYTQCTYMRGLKLTRYKVAVVASCPVCLSVCLSRSCRLLSR